MAMTNPFDPLSEQLNTMERSFKGNPVKAQQFAAIQPPTLEALTAQRVLNTHAKEKRKMQEELFMARTGNPNTTVNDDLKTQNVQLAKDITNLEMNRAEAAGAVGQQQEMARQNALNKLVAANKGGAGGLGALLNNPNAARRPTTAGVPGLPANNMRGMPTGGITTQPAMPTMKAAHGGIVAFKEGDLVEGEDEVQINSIPGDTSNNNEDDTDKPPSLEGASIENVQAVINDILSERRKATRAAEDRYRQGIDGESRRDKLVRRMLGFAGAETFGQGVVRSAQQERAFQQARKDRLEDQLSGLRKEEGAIDEAVIRAALETGALEQRALDREQEQEQFGQTIGLEKLKLTTQQKLDILTLKQRAAEFKSELDFRIQDANAKNKLQAMGDQVEAQYKAAMVQLEKVANVNKATALAVQLTQLRNDFFTTAETIMRGEGATAQEISTRMTDVLDTYERNSKKTLNQIVGVKDAQGASTAVTNMVGGIEGISVGENMPATITGGANTFDIDVEAQKLTDEYLGKNREKNKKRGGIISLM